MTRNRKGSQVITYKKHIYRADMIQYLNHEICTEYDLNTKIKKNKEIYIRVAYKGALKIAKR